MWDYDDETVNPQNGQGERIPGTNDGVPSGIGQANAPAPHTFAYGSAFDPIRGCIRPPLPSTQPNCPGDIKGPAIPGYPNGTPAFQIQVAVNWDLQMDTTYWSNGGSTTTGWRTVDLRLFGAPNPWYTQVTLVPLFVVDGGAVTP